MPALLIVTGPPGAGKSTVASVLASRFDPSVLVEGDAFFGFVARGAISPWLPQSDRQNEVVTPAGAAAAGRYALGGYTSLYDGVVGPWFLPTFLRASGLDRVEYVVLLPSVERCVARVGARRGHGFGDEGATRAMHRQFAEAGMEPPHLLLDPSDEPDQVADQVTAALERGLLGYTGIP